jgi:hypothetical protein
MAVLIVMIIAAFVAVSNLNWFSGPSGSAPCVGGPVPGGTAQSIGSGNYKFNCAGGGSMVVHVGN